MLALRICSWCARPRDTGRRRFDQDSVRAAWVPVRSGGAKRQRAPPYHRDCRPRAGERRLLRRRAGHAPGQAERQSGRPRHRPPVLCRRRGASGLRPDLLSLDAHGAAALRPRPGGRNQSGSAERQSRVLGPRASRNMPRGWIRSRPASAPGRCRSSIRMASGWRWWSRPPERPGPSRRSTPVRWTARSRSSACTAPACGSTTRRGRRRFSPGRLASRGWAKTQAGRAMGFRTPPVPWTSAKPGRPDRAPGASAVSITWRGGSTTRPTR